MTVKLMLDSNCFDRLAEDDETYNELLNRPDLRCMLTEVQRDELAAIADKARAAQLLSIADKLCSRLSAAPGTASTEPVLQTSGHIADGLILAAAERHCDILVTNDEGLRALAKLRGQPCLSWRSFLRRYVWKG